MHKKYYAVLLLLLGTVAGCAGLRGTSGAASEIVVDTPYSAREVFNRVGRELQQRGYTFEEINPAFGAIRTDPRRLNDSVRVQIAVDVTDIGPAQLRLWGWYRTPQGNFRITESDQQGTASHQAWRELNDIGRWIPGSTRYQ